MFQTYQSQTPVNLFTRVNGVDEARAYQMPPNSAVPLFENGEDIFYSKTTDGAGFSTLRAFRFEEIPLPSSLVQRDYVTRDELDSLSHKIDRLMEALGGTDG